MQIHELNAFLGALDAGTFLAVDDGDDTGRLSVEALLRAVNERIDNIITSPAPTEQEIIDARRGWNEVVYSSLGAAIRSQVKQILAQFYKFNTYDLLAVYGTPISRTRNGVTFTWDDAGQVCEVSGEAVGGDAYASIYTQTGAWQGIFERGVTYTIGYETTDPNVKLRIAVWEGVETTPDYYYFDEDGHFGIPPEAAKIDIDLWVESGDTVSAVVKNVYMLRTYTAKEVTATIRDAMIGADRHMYSSLGEAIREQLNGKVDKVTGKGLSTNDFTDADKTKLDDIEAGSEVNAIEAIKLDGTELTPDENRAVNIPVDETLTAEGVPADAKATGKAIDEMLPYIEKTLVPGTAEEQIEFPNVGALSTSGVLLPSETAYKTTDYISLDNVTGIYRTGTTVKFALWRYCFYDANKNFILARGSDSFVDYDIVDYNGKQVTWLDLSDVEGAEFIRITYDTSRPYTYYKVYESYIDEYDIPKVTINGVEFLPFYGKKIVNFGDSLFGNFRDTNETTDKSISKMIADATGATVYNCGFGGCRMSYHSQYWRAFSMYSLADAITTNVWTEQDAAIAAAPSGMPAYFSETLALLKTIDFSEVDYITIGYGTNDYTGDIFIDYRSGLEEYQYFKGAIEYSVRKILTEFPHIRIAIISPCWRWFLADGVYSYSSDDSQSVNSRGLYLYDYVAACKEMCEKLHIPYIDTYYTLGLNEWTHLEYFPSNDGTHLNQKGRQLRADRIVGQMDSMF